MGVLNDLWTLAVPMVAGGLLMLMAVGVGWSVAAQPSFLAVRGVSHWIFEIVLPLVRSRSGVVRTAVIFVNNTCVCALLVSLGPWGIGPWCGIVIVGWTLGAAMRLMTDASVDVSAASDGDCGGVFWVPPRDVSLRRRVRIGVLLNLLEPPAIAISIGLSLGQNAVWESIGSSRAWGLFLILVVPLLFLAAIGESLWLGSGGDSSQGDIRDGAGGGGGCDNNDGGGCDSHEECDDITDS